MTADGLKHEMSMQECRALQKRNALIPNLSPGMGFGGRREALKAALAAKEAIRILAAWADSEAA